jgi:hypothetical protein
MFGGFLVAVCVIEDEFMILHILRYTIDLYFWLMNLDHWIEARDRIDLPIQSLLFK